MQAFSHYLAELSFLYGDTVACEPQMRLDLGYLVAHSLDEKQCHLIGSIYIIMCIVPSTIGKRRMLARSEYHVELLGCLATQTLFKFVGDGIGIYEHHAHLLCHIGRRKAIVAMGVVEGVALKDVVARLGIEIAQLLVIIVLLHF